MAAGLLSQHPPGPHPAPQQGPQGTLSVKGSDWDQELGLEEKGEGPVAPQCPQPWQGMAQGQVGGLPLGVSAPSRTPSLGHPSEGRKEQSPGSGGLDGAPMGGWAPTALNGCGDLTGRGRWELLAQLWGCPLGAGGYLHSLGTHNVPPAARRGKMGGKSGK